MLIYDFEYILNERELIMSYANFLNLWITRLKIKKLYQFSELSHPQAEEIYKRGSDLAAAIGIELGLKYNVGGSALIINGKNTLLKNDTADIDIRIWINSKSEFNKAVEYIKNKYPISEEKDQSDKPDIIKTGLPGRLLSWDEILNNIKVRLEIQVRSEPTEGYYGLARKRLERLDDNLLIRYLNAKLVAKNESEKIYKEFKNQEKKFWDIDPVLEEAILSIHRSITFKKTRMSGASQSDHMRNTAYKVLALGGDWIEFTIAYLHDCIEEASNQDSATTLIKSNLAGIYNEDQIEYIINCIKILTEDELNEKEISDCAEPDRFIIDLFAKMNEVYNPDEAFYHLKYIKKYNKFNLKLQENKELIAKVEIADRWEGLSDMEYLRRYSKTKQFLSIARIYSTLYIMGAPELLFREVETICKDYDIDYQHIAETMKNFS